MRGENLSWAEWNPTMRCPAVFAHIQPEISGSLSGCSYCYAALGMPHNEVERAKYEGEELSTAAAKLTLDNLAARQISRLSVLGGEPQYRKDFTDLIRYANRKFKLVSVTTNGMGTPRNIDALMEASIVEVSLDSHDLQTASRTRPPTVVQSALRAVDLLYNHDFLCLSSVITPDSLKTLPTFIDWAFEQKNVKRICLYPLLGNSEVPSQLALSERQAREAMVDLSSKYPTYGERYCKAGKHVVVNHDGSILPCAAFFGDSMDAGESWNTIEKFSLYDFVPLAPTNTLESPGCPGRKLYESGWNDKRSKLNTANSKEEKQYCMRCNYEHEGDGKSCPYCGFGHFDSKSILMMCSAFTIYNPRFFPKLS